jgi:hypothetical protein
VTTGVRDVVDQHYPGVIPGARLRHQQRADGAVPPDLHVV